MKKIDYQKPEMELIVLNTQAHLLTMSDGENGGADNPKPWNPDDDE